MQLLIADDIATGADGEMRASEMAPRDSWRLVAALLAGTCEAEA